VESIDSPAVVPAGGVEQGHAVAAPAPTAVDRTPEILETIIEEAGAAALGHFVPTSGTNTSSAEAAAAPQPAASPAILLDAADPEAAAAPAARVINKEPAVGSGLIPALENTVGTAAQSAVTPIDVLIDVISPEPASASQPSVTGIPAGFEVWRRAWRPHVQPRRGSSEPARDTSSTVSEPVRQASDTAATLDEPVRVQGGEQGRPAVPASTPAEDTILATAGRAVGQAAEDALSHFVPTTPTPTVASVAEKAALSQPAASSTAASEAPADAEPLAVVHEAPAAGSGLIPAFEGTVETAARSAVTPINTLIDGVVSAELTGASQPQVAGINSGGGFQLFGRKDPILFVPKPSERTTPASNESRTTPPSGNTGPAEVPLQKPGQDGLEPHQPVRPEPAAAAPASMDAPSSIQDPSSPKRPWSTPVLTSDGSVNRAEKPGQGEAAAISSDGNSIPVTIAEQGTEAALGHFVPAPSAVTPILEAVTQPAISEPASSAATKSEVNANPSAVIINEEAAAGSVLAQIVEDVTATAVAAALSPANAADIVSADPQAPHVTDTTYILETLVLRRKGILNTPSAVSEPASKTPDAAVAQEDTIRDGTPVERTDSPASQSAARLPSSQAQAGPDTANSQTPSAPAAAAKTDSAINAAPRAPPAGQSAASSAANPVPAAPVSATAGPAAHQAPARIDIPVRSSARTPIMPKAAALASRWISWNAVFISLSGAAAAIAAGLWIHGRTDGQLVISPPAIVITVLTAALIGVLRYRFMNRRPDSAGSSILDLSPASPAAPSKRSAPYLSARPLRLVSADLYPSARPVRSLSAIPLLDSPWLPFVKPADWQDSTIEDSAAVIADAEPALRERVLKKLQAQGQLELPFSAPVVMPDPRFLPLDIDNTYINWAAQQPPRSVRALDAQARRAAQLARDEHPTLGVSILMPDPNYLTLELDGDWINWAAQQPPRSVRALDAQARRAAQLARDEHPTLGVSILMPDPRFLPLDIANTYINWSDRHSPTSTLREKTQARLDGELGRQEHPTLELPIAMPDPRYLALEHAGDWINWTLWPISVALSPEARQAREIKASEQLRQEQELERRQQQPPSVIRTVAANYKRFETRRNQLEQDVLELQGMWKKLRSSEEAANHERQTIELQQDRLERRITELQLAWKELHQPGRKATKRERERFESQLNRLNREFSEARLGQLELSGARPAWNNKRARERFEAQLDRLDQALSETRRELQQRRQEVAARGRERFEARLNRLKQGLSELQFAWDEGLRQPGRERVEAQLDRLNRDFSNARPAWNDAQAQERFEAQLNQLGQALADARPAWNDVYQRGQQVAAQVDERYVIPFDYYDYPEREAAQEAARTALLPSILAEGYENEISAPTSKAARRLKRERDSKNKELGIPMVPSILESENVISTPSDKVARRLKRDRDRGTQTLSNRNRREQTARVIAAAPEKPLENSSKRRTHPNRRDSREILVFASAEARPVERLGNGVRFAMPDRIAALNMEWPHQLLQRVEAFADTFPTAAAQDHERSNTQVNRLQRRVAAQGRRRLEVRLDRLNQEFSELQSAWNELRQSDSKDAAQNRASVDVQLHQLAGALSELQSMWDRLPAALTQNSERLNTRLSQLNKALSELQVLWRLYHPAQVIPERSSTEIKPEKKDERIDFLPEEEGAEPIPPIWIRIKTRVQNIVLMVWSSWVGGAIRTGWFLAAWIPQKVWAAVGWIARKSWSGVERIVWGSREARDRKKFAARETKYRKKFEAELHRFQQKLSKAQPVWSELDPSDQAIAARDREGFEAQLNRLEQEFHQAQISWDRLYQPGEERVALVMFTAEIAAALRQVRQRLTPHASPASITLDHDSFRSQLRWAVQRVPRSIYTAAASIVFAASGLLVSYVFFADPIQRFIVLNPRDRTLRITIEGSEVFNRTPAIHSMLPSEEPVTGILGSPVMFFGAVAVILALAGAYVIYRGMIAANKPEYISQETLLALRERYQRAADREDRYLPDTVKKLLIEDAVIGDADPRELGNDAFNGDWRLEATEILKENYIDERGWDQQALTQEAIKGDHEAERFLETAKIPARPNHRFLERFGLITKEQIARARAGDIEAQQYLDARKRGYLWRTGDELLAWHAARAGDASAQRYLDARARGDLSGAEEAWTAWQAARSAARLASLEKAESRRLTRRQRMAPLRARVATLRVWVVEGYFRTMEFILQTERKQQPVTVPALASLLSEDGVAAVDPLWLEFDALREVIGEGGTFEDYIAAKDALTELMSKYAYRADPSRFPIASQLESALRNWPVEAWAVDLDGLSTGDLLVEGALRVLQHIDVVRLESDSALLEMWQEEIASVRRIAVDRRSLTEETAGSIARRSRKFSKSRVPIIRIHADAQNALGIARRLVALKAAQQSGQKGPEELQKEAKRLAHNIRGLNSQWPRIQTRFADYLRSLEIPIDETDEKPQPPSKSISYLSSAASIAGPLIAVVLRNLPRMFFIIPSLGFGIILTLGEGLSLLGVVPVKAAGLTPTLLSRIVDPSPELFAGLLTGAVALIVALPRAYARRNSGSSSQKNQERRDLSSAA
jgi:hypothetical protein